MKNKKIILFFIIGLAIMGVMLYYIGIDDVINALEQSNLWLVLLAFLIQIFTYFLYTWRWHIINNTANMSLGIKRLFPMVLVSLAVNNITPSGRGGGEPVRAYLLAKEGNYKFEDTFASVIADRSFDTFPFLILSILTIVGIIYSFSLDTTILAILIICVTGITIAVAILIYVCINEAFGVKITAWVIRIVKRFYKKYDDDTEKRIVEAVISFQSTMNLLLRNRTIMLYAFPLSFIIWVFEILRVYFVFLAFGATISPVVIGEVFIIASLVGMVPLLPGGLGAVDGIMILLYSGAGLTASLSAAATLVERLISFWMATFLGLIFMMMFGTNVLDRSFSLAESETANNDELSEEGKRILDQIDDASADESADESADDDLSDGESEEAVLEVIEDGEESLEEKEEKEKEVLEEKISN